MKVKNVRFSWTSAAELTATLYERPEVSFKANKAPSTGLAQKQNPLFSERLSAHFPTIDPIEVSCSTLLYKFACKCLRSDCEKLLENKLPVAMALSKQFSLLSLLGHAREGSLVPRSWMALFAWLFSTQLDNSNLEAR
jgi:hypothetical protein